MKQINMYSILSKQNWYCADWFLFFVCTLKLRLEHITILKVLFSIDSCRRNNIPRVICLLFRSLFEYCFLKENTIFKFYWIFFSRLTAQKMKFSIKDFFSKCDQIRSKLRIWSHLLKISLMENFIFCALILMK